MSLTADEKKHIQEAIAKFREKHNDNMVIFYQALLTDYPQYQAHFAKLKDVKVADFPKNQWLHDQQGPKTGDAINHLIQKMDDPTALRAAVKNLVHMPQHTSIKLKKEDYHNAFKALAAALSKANTNPNAAAWGKLTDIIVAMVGEELK